jgi:NAD(P)-dependent dehydrogenase (short-subunit alcohol dehydrogenase family)
MDRLKDKVVFITGSFSGIGKAIAQECLKEGAKVVLHGKEETDRNGWEGVLDNEQTMVLIGDLMDSGFPARAINKIIERYGKLDAVVNNAALIVASSLEDTDLELFRDVLEVNALAPFAIIKEALPYLVVSKGNVLNIGSVNAYAGEPTLLPYSVSKGALMTLTRNLGDSLHRQHGVRVNQINPGWVLTDKEVERKREHGLPDDWFAKISTMYAPSKRLISPQEIAFASIYWLSDFCGPISGQVVELEQHPLIGRNPQKDLDSLQQ